MKRKIIKKMLREEYGILLKSLKRTNEYKDYTEYEIKGKENVIYTLRVISVKVTKHEEEKIKELLKNQLYLMLKAKLNMIEYPIVTIKGDYTSRLNSLVTIIYRSDISSKKQKTLKKEDAMEIGKSIARLHLATKIVPEKMFEEDKTDTNHYKLKFEKYYEYLNKNADSYYERKLKLIINKNKETIDHIIKNTLKKENKIALKKGIVLTHGSLHPENILFTKTGVLFKHAHDIVLAPKEKDLVYFVKPGLYESVKQGYESIIKNTKFRKYVILYYYELKILEHLEEVIDVLIDNNPRNIKKDAFKKLQSEIIPELNQYEKMSKLIKKII